MPYIKQDDRPALDTGMMTPSSTGELNYSLTQVISDYLVRNGLSYNTLSQIKAALDDCKDEFYRRIYTPYEEFKRRVNGDVYPPDIIAFLEGLKDS